MQTGAEVVRMGVIGVLLIAGGVVLALYSRKRKS
ncbi:MAG: LPXTG cell wall anchor domain-containing protein [Thermoleophilia bacterium]